ncbi:MAG: glycosyltransferase, partial [Thermodesulfobacteriota bacterium]
KIYSQARIVLCLHYRDPDGKVPCLQAAPRVYEAMACGAFLMVDPQRDVKRLFRSGDGLVVFKDVKELRELICYYLDHPKERKAIANKGREMVLSKHTYRHRMQEMLSIVTGGEYCAG